MKKFILISLLGFVFKCHGQMMTDVHRKYLYSVDNQMDNINGLSIGMMQMSILQNNRLTSFSSEMTEFCLSSLEQNSVTSYIVNQVSTNATTVGFDNWGGYTMNGNYTGKNNHSNYFSISASSNTIDRLQKLENNEVENKSAGFLVNGHYNYSKSKIYFKSNLELCKDQRNYDVVNSQNKLHIDNNYGMWSNYLQYSINANSSLLATASIMGYGGSIDANSFTYNGYQSLVNLKTSWKQTLKNFTMNNGITFQTYLDNNVFSRRQNRWEYSNSISPYIKSRKITGTIKNAFIRTDSTTFFYAPSMAINFNYGHHSLQILANRILRTRANSLECWPYYTYSDEGIQNIAIEQIHGYNSLWLNNEFKFIQMIRYQQFQNFGIAGNSLKRMTRASLGIERNMGYYKKWNYDAIYHFRFLGEGELAMLAPIHTAIAHVNRRPIKAKLINKFAHTHLNWSGGVSTGYRSRTASITDGQISDERMRNLFFTDMSYTLTNNNSGYYEYESKGLWQLTIVVQNIFNAQTLTAFQQETTNLLLTEGIRTARQIKIGLTYKFR